MKNTSNSRQKNCLLSSFVGLILFLLHGVSAQTYHSTKQIGTVSLPPYQNFSGNLRHIARTTTDRLIVVYTDDYQSVNHVFWMSSPDGGETWADPIILAEGCQPVVTIDETNKIYIVWQANDQKALYLSSLPDSSDSWTEPVSIPAIDSKLVAYPNIEVDDSGVLLLWSNGTIDSWQLLFQKFSRENLQPVSEPETKENGNSENPIIGAISTDIRFEPGPIHIAWTRGTCSYLQYPPFFQDYYLNDAYSPCAAISVENYKKYSVDTGSYFYMYFATLALAADGYLVTGFVDLDNNLNNGTLTLYGCEFEQWNAPSDYYTCSGYPCVDDVIDNSCALVWTQGQHILYSQLHFGNFESGAIKVISESEEEKHQVNVCYRTFREDFMDIVWLEGSEAPYKIMYCRYPKGLSDDYVKVTDISTINFQYNFFSSLKIEVKDGTPPYTWHILKGKLPDGLTFDSRTGELSGTPGESGFFTWHIGVKDSSEWPTYAEKRISVNIKNSAPRILSPDTVFVKTNTSFEHTFNIYDSDNNPFEYEIKYTDSWIKTDSCTISGLVPAEFKWTTITVTASDGDKSSERDIIIQNEDFVSAVKPVKLPICNFAFSPNYPNPFNNHTSFKYDLPQSENVKIMIYNISGELIESFQLGEKSAGAHSFNWNASDWASGTYFIKFEAGDFRQIRKCVLLQ